MRVAIYQRWLSTLGGGERFTLELARALQLLGWSVDILTHTLLDQQQLAQRLGFADQFSLVYLPLDPLNSYVTHASADYDLFINLSQGDLPLAQATHNFALPFFPLQLAAYSSTFALTAPRTAPLLVRGIYALEQHAELSWAWTGSTTSLTFNYAGRLAARSLLLGCAPVWPANLPAPTVAVYLDDHLIATRSDWWTHWRIALPTPRTGSVSVQLQITPWTLPHEQPAQERGIPLSYARLEHAAQRWRKPQSWQTAEPVAEPDQLASYQHVWTISEFCAAWVQRRWQRKAAILYPAVESCHLKPDTKQPQILSVGRFFTGAHNKKHVAMIQTFKQLCDAGLAGWTYQLVGGCDLAQPEQRAYLEALQAQAAGYPIQFHVNLDLAGLQQRYGSASLFWHAAGFGEDADQAPERFEHFGIATVEAMAAGCVPLVINGAGQREIVSHMHNGLLWDSREQLAHYTHMLVADSPLRQQLAMAAQQRAHDFSPAAFQTRVQHLLAELGLV